MGKVRSRLETGKLFIDFYYLGIRCREQTSLRDTAANRRKVEKLMQRIEASILVGEFNFAESFPNSSNLRKVQQKLAVMKIVEQEQSGEDVVTLTFAAFAEQWFREKEVEWRNSYAANIRLTLNRSLLPTFGELPLTIITKTDLLEYRTKLARKKGRCGNAVIAPKTVNSHMTILRMILNEASERFGFDTPFKNIKPLKVRKQQIDPFSLREVEKILKHVRQDYRNYLIVRFYTGMRTGEINGLKWKHVNFETREILVRETYANGRTEYTKTDGSQREIPMFGPVYEALKEQYEGTGKGEYVFCNRAGQPLDQNNFAKRVWYPLLKLLGLKPRRPYQTRHTAATLMLGSGENPEWIARTLGHSTTKMLFDVYSRYVPNLTRRDGSAFERLVGNYLDEADGDDGHDDA